MTALRAENITVGYPDGPLIVNDVSIAAERAEIVVMLGPNGAGKSTLAKAIVGLLRIKGGQVYLGEKRVTGTKPHQLVREGLAYLPQLRNVFNEMSVIENLQMGGYSVKSDLGERVTTVLDIFPDLAVDRRKKAGTLSGGQQRMLALARMMMTDPSAAVLDEPTAGLSPIYAEKVWNQIRSIRDRGVGMIVIEQNAAIAMDHADQVILLSQGKRVLGGKAAEMREHDQVARILVG
jgi:ABC-type branched-subunit amino acid transport system ATPase component